MNGTRLHTMLVVASLLSMFAKGAEPADDSRASKRLETLLWDKSGFPCLVTELDVYEEVLKKFDPQLASHFPSTVGRDCRMVYWMGILQGATLFYVADPATDEEMDRVAEKYKDKPRLIDLPEEDGKGGKCVLRPSNCVAKDPDEKFRNEKDVIMLVVEDLGAATSSQWNHGIQAGIYLDRDNDEIVYWVKHW